MNGLETTRRGKILGPELATGVQSDAFMP